MGGDYPAVWPDAMGPRIVSGRSGPYIGGPDNRPFLPPVSLPETLAKNFTRD